MDLQVHSPLLDPTLKNKPERSSVAPAITVNSDFCGKWSITVWRQCSAVKLRKVVFARRFFD